jgi:tripartite-type tricarboxylate transporter receptor subunit TctC
MLIFYNLNPRIGEGTIMKKFLVLIMTVVLLFTLAGCGQDNSAEVSEGAGNEAVASEESFPSKPIEVIVAYKAGGGTDTGARILTSAAEKLMDQPLVILNKPGADGELGFTELANAKADGYTIGFINLPTFVSLPLQRETQYSKEDVTPILNHVYDPGVLVVRGDSEWTTLEEFVAYAKENPEAITVSNNGTGASNHIGAAHLAYEADIKLTHVPFGGSADMLAALRGGHVNATVAKISEVAALAKSGELRILASFTDERLAAFEEVPTLTEMGYPVLFGSARAIVAPKGTPDEIVQKLHDVLKEAIESEEHMEAAKNANLPIQYMSPEDLQKYMDDSEEYLKGITTKIDLN